MYQYHLSDRLDFFKKFMYELYKYFKNILVF